MPSKTYEDMCADIIGKLRIQLAEAELEVDRLTKILQEHRDRDIVRASLNSLSIQDEKS